MMSFSRKCYETDAVAEPSCLYRPRSTGAAWPRSTPRWEANS